MACLEIDEKHFAESTSNFQIGRLFKIPNG